jgi:hypothetical protein
MCKLVQGIGKLNRREFSVLAFKVNACGCTHPEGSIKADKDVVDDAIGNSLVCAIALKLAAVVAIKPVLCPHPKVAHPVLLDGGDVGIAKTLDILAKTVPLS